MWDIYESDLEKSIIFVNGSGLLNESTPMFTGTIDI